MTTQTTADQTGTETSACAVGTTAGTAKTAKGNERRRVLLEHAIDTFIEYGYEGTSLDKIIKKSGGSRSTVYQSYGNKEGLFMAALVMMADGIYSAYMDDYRTGRTVREEFEVFGKIFLTAMLTPRAIGACRLIFAESARLPHIGDWFYTQGIARSYQCFAKVLENHFDAPMEELTETAARFIEMLRGPLLLKSVCLTDQKFTPEEIDREVAKSCDIIMAYVTSRYKERS